MRRVVADRLLCTLAASVLGAGAASAQPVVNAPLASATASSSTHQGPNVGSSTIRIDNGDIVSSFANPGGAVAAGPTAPGSYSVWAESNMSGFSSGALFTSTRAEADLTRGLVRGVVSSSGPATFGTPQGGVTSRIADTITFLNMGSSDLALGLSWSFEGSVIPPGDASANLNGSSALGLSGCSGCGNIRFFNNSPVGEELRAFFGPSGVTGYATTSGNLSRWTISPYGDEIGATLATTLLIPAGQSTLGISADLLFTCGNSTNCDFGNTGLFRFDPLPTGLSYTSASGVFLSSTGAVPEPATWAMLIVGFGTVGLAVRKNRRRDTSLACA